MLVVVGSILGRSKIFSFRVDSDWKPSLCSKELELGQDVLRYSNLTELLPNQDQINLSCAWN